MSISEIGQIASYTASLQALLERANHPNRQVSIQSALSPEDLTTGAEEIINSGKGHIQRNHQARYAAIETAFRNVFYELLASTKIVDSSFNRVWALLDILSILSDNEQCEAALVFWLVEELLDSQTIDGCSKVFDYLESRRERMTAKNFKGKQLVILRACNELLRRLSRAEDTVFCGRVFIYLFQSFPLGDKSSVNLRGEYHVDNVTLFDKLPTNDARSPRLMELDIDSRQQLAEQGGQAAPSAELDLVQNDHIIKVSTEVKAIKMDGKTQETEKPVLDMDALYPIFWSLQDYFSTPTKLFDPSKLQSFRAGMEATLGKFKQVYRDIEVRGNARSIDESKRSTKRKRGGTCEELATSFNPKYLTSRDLFELEISDLAFRRHVLVQALILIDFLLSLTPKAKSKLENVSNKSVLYAYTLEEEDAKWATRMRTDIAAYLQQGAEGKFYYRMVDTVLSRDKNWVRWKAENCPPFQRTSVSAEAFVDAKSGAQRACGNKRLRATPLGTLDLSFLSDGESPDGLDQLKDPARYSIPMIEDFRGPIGEDDFDLEMATTEEEKQLLANARASKLWRTLRIASKSKLNLLDRIDDGHNLQALFGGSGDENGPRKAADGDDIETEPSNALHAPSMEVSTTIELDSILATETVVK